MYFRESGVCDPKGYKKARTVFTQAINSKDKKKYGHPTIKPVNIIETLIENSSKENDVVLDCFAGSGTIGVACESLNRNYILIEKQKKYIDVIQQRIKESSIQKTLF